MRCVISFKSRKLDTTNKSMLSYYVCKNYSSSKCSSDNNLHTLIINHLSPLRTTVRIWFPINLWRQIKDTTTSLPSVKWVKFKQLLNIIHQIRNLVWAREKLQRLVCTQIKEEALCCHQNPSKNKNYLNQIVVQKRSREILTKENLRELWILNQVVPKRRPSYSHFKLWTKFQRTPSIEKRLWYSKNLSHKSIWMCIKHLSFQILPKSLVTKTCFFQRQIFNHQRPLPNPNVWQSKMIIIGNLIN